MTAASSLASYPGRYLEIAGEFQTGKRRLALKRPSEKAAVSLRLDLYRFRRTLKQEGLEQEYSQFFAVRMFVRGKVLVLIHADETFK